MDIDDSSEEWGADIGYACDILLNSDCSLIGGFYHVTQSGDSWANTDRHLEFEVPNAEEFLDIKVPMFQYSPRELSVHRYMHMDLSKTSPGDTLCLPVTSPADNTSDSLSQTVMMNDGSKINEIQNLTKLGTSSTNTRPKSSGDKGRPADNRPKFFRLGEYPGTTRFTAECVIPGVQNPRKLPHFTEIQLHHQRKVTDDTISISVSNAPSRKKLAGAITTSGMNKNGVTEINMESTTNVHKRDSSNVNKNNMTVSKNTNLKEVSKKNASEAGKKAGEHSKSSKECEMVSAERNRKHRSNKVKTRHIKVKPVVDLREDNQQDNDHIIRYSDSKRINRLRKALKGLRNRLRSVFSACISSGH